MDEKPLRLWLVSPHFYPTYGGAQHRYRGYIPGFLDRGMDVRIMAGTPKIEEHTEADASANWYGEEPGAWLPTDSLDGVDLERIRLPDSGNLARTQLFYSALLDLCRRAPEKRVVLQVLTNLRPEALPWLRQLREEGVVVLYNVSQFPRWPKKKLKNIYRRFAYRKVYNQFDALVTNSEAIVTFLRDLGVKTRIEYIPNGVDLGRFHPAQTITEREEAKALRQNMGIPPEHRVIVTIGAVMPRKGQDKLVQAWRTLLSRHPDTHLLIIGPRSDLQNPKFVDFGSELAGLIESSGAAERVHFTGLVKNVDALLRASDVFALASDREGTPNSVLEAMATGLPCVVTPFDGISAAIGVAGTHYQLVKRQPQPLADALSALLDSETQRRELGDSGLRFVQESADQKDSLDSYAQLYADLSMSDPGSTYDSDNYVWR